jgi:hypothetical protein
MALDPPLEFPEVCAGDPIVLSATTYLAFRQCPEQASGRLRGMYPAESRASFLGGLAHRVFARHLREGPIGDAELASVCREEIGASMNPKMNALGLKPSALQQVIEEVGSLYERFRRLGMEGFAGAEMFLEVEPSVDVKLLGSVDAVFEEGAGVRLVDWKTGSLGDPLPQLGFYALLWALERGELPSRVEAVSVGTGERIEDVPSRESLETVARQAADAVDALRSSWESDTALPRTAGPWCRWCPLLDECEEGRSAASILGG